MQRADNSNESAGQSFACNTSNFEQLSLKLDHVSNDLLRLPDSTGTSYRLTFKGLALRNSFSSIQVIVSHAEVTYWKSTESHDELGNVVRLIIFYDLRLLLGIL